jgi:putative NADH-flavin reductase
MQVTILGASGQVGQQVVRLCLERGHQVVALVHSQNPFGEQAGLTIVTGDIYNQADIKTAVSGSQAVISTLGSWHTEHKNILESALRSLIPAMEQQGIKRIITVTGAAALWSGDRPGFFDRTSRAVLYLIAPKILRDGEAHLAQLAASSLDWTSIRSPSMTKKQQTSYTLRNKLPFGLTIIPRVAVATALVDQLERNDFLQQAPVIYGR